MRTFTNWHFFISVVSTPDVGEGVRVEDQLGYRLLLHVHLDLNSACQHRKVLKIDVRS